MIEAGAREGNADATRVTQTEDMGGTGARETNTVTVVVTGNSANTSKEKVSGRRGRDTIYCLTDLLSSSTTGQPSSRYSRR